MPKQRLMSRAQFETFVAGERGQRPGGSNGPIVVLVPPPYQLVRCDCGDVNCHGWRFVESRGERASRELTYEEVYA